MVSFNLCTVLNSMMKSCAVPLCPAWESFQLPTLCTLPAHPPLAEQTSQLQLDVWNHSACVQVALILLSDGPKAQQLAIQTCQRDP